MVTRSRRAVEKLQKCYWLALSEPGSGKMGRFRSAVVLIRHVLIAALAWPAAAGSGADVTLATMDDPSRDGWSSEVLQSRAGRQLAKIENFLAHDSADAANAIRSILAEDFRCCELRPSFLLEAFRDSTVVVLRPKSRLGSIPQGKPDHHGTEGLATALRPLVARDSIVVRPKFKIYQIEVKDDIFFTRQLLTLFSQSKGSSREIHAVWRCRWLLADAGSPPLLQSIELEDYEETISNRGTVLFSECSESVFGGNECFTNQLGHGLDYWADRYLRVGTEGMQGLAVGDVNGDGLEDVYVCQISPLPNRLFVQNPDGTATERAAEAGVDWHDPTHSALLIDVDNDGDPDLLVGTRAALLIMENDGQGHFAVRARLAAARNAYSLSAADYDNDRDLDLFACLYLPRARHREVLAVPEPFHDARNGGRNLLLRNDGQWRFADVTRETGLEPEATRRSFASAWEDYDNDGDIDFYVANDYGPNNLFRNDGGRFTDVARQAGVVDQSFGMSCSWGDFNRDGLMDLYVSNMFSAAGNRIVFQRRFRPGDSAELRGKFQYMARGNSLFQNTGRGDFLDVSLEAAVNVGYWAWGSQFADLTNDGFEDLVVTNGFLTRDNPHDL
jgi:hypothetical protein